MKLLFGWPTRESWRPPKPSRVTSRGLAVSEGEDHGLIPAAKVEVSLELALETGPGLALEIGPPEASLGIMLGLTVKATLMVTYGACIPSPQMNLCPGGEWVSHDPKDKKDPVKEETSCITEPSVDDLEMWLEFQAGHLGTPPWWEELGAMPGIEDQHKFTWKIRASFYVLEVRFRASLEWGYTAPLAPQSLNRSAFLPERLTYQDVRQQPALLTIAYAQCLQHWVEKHNLPKNPDFCPWAESVRIPNCCAFRVEAIWHLLQWNLKFFNCFANTYLNLSSC